MRIPGIPIVHSGLIAKTGMGRYPPWSVPQRSLRLRHIVVALVQLGLLGLTVALVVTGHGNATGTRNPFGPITTPGPPVTPGPPPAIAFSFPSAKVITVPVGRPRTEAARLAARSVQTTLSGFYSAGFVQIRDVPGGPPDLTWSAFSPVMRTRARKDAPSLSLVGPQTEAPLEVSRSDLVVWVLLDPSGKPATAVASVNFGGRTELPDGQQLLVTNTARLILKPSGGHWLIVGYPRARTYLNAIPTTGPSPSASPTAIGTTEAA
jgi:hypothetical protein